MVIVVPIAQHQDSPLVLQSRWYIMDPEYLSQVSQASIATHGDNTTKIIDFIVTNLTETYGSRYINPRQDEWVFNNAGGAMGSPTP